MMNKRAQVIGQVFMFILAGILFVLILGYGYKAIMSFMERGEQVQLLDFRNQLDSTFSIIKRDYGSVQQVNVRVPPKTEQVCFVNTYNDLTGAQQQALETRYPLFASAWSTGSENIFLIPRQPTPILVKDIQVASEGFCCIAAVNGRVSLRVEGTGNKALLAPWPPETCK